MELRRDALTAAAEWILAVEGLARETDGLVATVGEARVEPGAGNVIPGRVALTLDIRDADDDAREAARDTLRNRARTIATTRGLNVEWEVVQETRAIACSSQLSNALATAAGHSGHRELRLTSGAGHDAAVMAALTPVAMLFVRCAGGVSHNPAESVAHADVAAAIEVIGRFLEAHHG
jgi:hydantoinase/carbamoylase family amidase